MEKKYLNPCIRCGKQRIDLKTWKEKITNVMGTSIIVHTETVCPDKECQKIVEMEFEVQRKKKVAIELDKENRRALFKLNNKNRIRQKKASK